ncbi:MAG: hypothetical protein AVDCRST_MAG59-3501, partial [uncultured Thermomicrobiales bacterium]
GASGLRSPATPRPVDAPVLPPSPWSRAALDPRAPAATAPASTPSPWDHLL